jgi:N-acetylneuraminic acid mutarotase/regulation of enolase protein 1 (concanavalin A-like superfamily)
VTTPVVNAWTDLDIGAPGKVGSAVVNATGTVAVTGGGADIWNQTDQFNLDYQPLVGNGTITAQVVSQTNTNGWAKGGIMIRESTDSDARFVLLALTPGNGVTWQVRSATHTLPTYTTTAGKAGVWLQITRVGSTFTGFMSTDGITWKQVGTANIPMVNNVAAGLAGCAHDNTKASVVTFASPSVTATGTAASTWSDLAPAPMTRWESQTFSYGGKLYVFGGFIDRNLDATSECDVYDPAANAWTDLTTIPVGGLTHAATTVVGDTVYFAGGTIGTFTNHSGATSTAEVLTYDLTTGAWGSTTSLPAPMSCGGMVCINNHLYYYGGLNGAITADLNTTYALDLSNPTAGWQAEAAMPNGRNHLGAAVINGIAYAVGGDHLYNTNGGNVAEVDAYNPVTNVWTKVASLPMPWSSNETTTMVVNNKIVIVGGQTNGGYDGIYLNAIEEYDPTANAWSQAGTLPEANEGESIAYVNGQLLVADGTVDNLGGWSQDQVWSTTAITL